MAIEIFQRGGKISVNGDLRLADLSRLCSAIYHDVREARYKDVQIDFRSLASIGFNVIPPLASYLRFLVRQDNVDFEYLEPTSYGARNRIEQTGLAHYICHNRYQQQKQISADPVLQQFKNTDEASAINDKIINSVLRTARLNRKHVAALEWALDEITDNVLNHSQSRIGGFIIHSKIPHKNIVEFVVADAGIGVARSLSMNDEVDAVTRAIEEGVTRNKISNQGNGLYGSYRLAVESEALFLLKSYHGNIYVTADGETHAKRDNVPYQGTYVVCQIDCDRPDLIEKAFVFQGRQHIPGYDFVERKHETDQEDIIVSAKDICKTFGSRKSGLEAFNYLLNMMSCLTGNKIIVDFSDVHVVSSSFADEAFGKLFLTLGPLTFMNTIQIHNADSAIETLINRAITLRMQTGLGS